MIGENDARGCVGLHHDMVVLALAGIGGRLLIDILPELALLAFGINAHAPRHAQMDHERLAVIEFGQQVFCAPPQLLDFATRQALGEMGREGHAQVAAAGHDLCEATTRHRGREAHFHRLDFGQFGHGDPAGGLT